MFDEVAFERMVERAVKKAVREIMADKPVTADIGGDRISLTEAGASFGYAANTIRGWIAKGRIMGFGKGRGLKVSRAEVKAFVDAGCPTGDVGPSSAGELASRADEVMKRRR